MTRVALVLVTLLAATVAADGPPRFEDYPVHETFRGTPVAPVLSTRAARNFRTELRRQAATGPDFAGHFTVATWKCGCCCNTVAVIDAISGEVRFAPFAFEDAFENGKIVCDRGSDHKIDSELFVVGGKVGDEVGRHYYRWHDRAFTRVYFEPGCS